MNIITSPTMPPCIPCGMYYQRKAQRSEAQFTKNSDVFTRRFQMKTDSNVMVTVELRELSNPQTIGFFRISFTNVAI